MGGPTAPAKARFPRKATGAAEAESQATDAGTSTAGDRRGAQRPLPFRSSGSAANLCRRSRTTAYPSCATRSNCGRGETACSLQRDGQVMTNDGESVENEPPRGWTPRRCGPGSILRGMSTGALGGRRARERGWPLDRRNSDRRRGRDGGGHRVRGNRVRTPAAPTYLLPDDEVVSAGPWKECDGVEIGERLDHWDPFTDLGLTRAVTVDLDTVRSECMLGPGSTFALIATWRAPTRTRLAGAGERVDLGGLTGVVRAPIAQFIPGPEAGGRLDLTTQSRAALTRSGTLAHLAPSAGRDPLDRDPSGGTGGWRCAIPDRSRRLLRRSRGCRTTPRGISTGIPTISRSRSWAGCGCS